MIKFATLISKINLSKVKKSAKEQGRKIYHIIDEALTRYFKNEK